MRSADDAAVQCGKCPLAAGADVEVASSCFTALIDLRTNAPRHAFGYSRRDRASLQLVLEVVGIPKSAGTKALASC